MRKSSADYRCKKNKNHIGDKFWGPDANRGHESSALAGGRAFVIIWVAAGRARLNYQSSTRRSRTVSLFLDTFKNAWRYLLIINGVQVAHRLMRVLFWWITKGWWCLMHKTGCSLLGGGGPLPLSQVSAFGRCWKLPWTRNCSWMCNTPAKAQEEVGFPFNTASRK